VEQFLLPPLAIVDKESLFELIQRCCQLINSQNWIFIQLLFLALKALFVLDHDVKGFIRLLHMISALLILLLLGILLLNIAFTYVAIKFKNFIRFLNIVLRELLYSCMELLSVIYFLHD